MNTYLLNLLKLIAAIIIGYATMILMLVLTQDLTLGRVIFGQTPLWKIILVGVGSFVSAFLGGLAAAKIYLHQKLLPQIVMCLSTIFETIWLIQNHKTPNPVWFDLIAESVLIIGLLSGGWFLLRKKKAIRTNFSQIN